MSTSKCHHIRIADKSKLNINVPEIIKDIERKFNIPITSLPQWKELIQQLHVTATDYKRIVQNARNRKALLINTLYVQNTRPSPFELSDSLARTAKKWKRIESDIRKINKKSKISHFLDVAPPNSIQENSETSLTIHPNMEILTSVLDIIDNQFQSSVRSKSPDPDIEQNNELNQDIDYLPSKVVVNQHNMVSPIGSEESCLSLAEPYINMEESNVSQQKRTECTRLAQTTSVKCSPRELIIREKTLDEQTFKFTVTNCSVNSVFIRFKHVVNPLIFNRLKIYPKLCVKLLPGLSLSYKIIFRLDQIKDGLSTELFFKIGYSYLLQLPVEAFCIPISTQFGARNVSVSEYIYIDPIYLWHLDSESRYPNGTIKLSVDDDYSYNVYIRKRRVNMSKILEEPVTLNQSSNQAPISSRQTNEDTFIKTDSKIMSSKYSLDSLKSEETVDIASFIAKEIIDLALDAFLLDCTFMHMERSSKHSISLCFHKAEHIGPHQSIYDVLFCNPVTNDVILNRTMIVFAEILAHPVKVLPEILDMSHSLPTHGFYEGTFTIMNSHKIFPVTVHIKLTTKMQKLFHLSHMKTVVAPTDSVKIAVRYCSTDHKIRKLDDSENFYVYFTFKIVLSGNQTVYRNVSAIFYEIIVPCARNFKMVYGDKYFKEDI